MALIKEIMTDVGIPANFWLVSKVDIDKVAEQALITVYGYMNREHSDMNQGYLSRVFVNVYPEDFRKVFDVSNLNKTNPYEIGYNYLKNTELFQDAKDSL